MADGALESATENIRILVRIRPPANDEKEASHCIRALDDQALEAVSSDGKKKLQCAYDHVVPPLATQEDVYSIVKSCTDAVLAGYNSTVFAYGQTGSGKTHTMFGPPGDSLIPSRSGSSAGIIPRAVHDIFSLSLDPTVTQYSVLCSFVQLYNENCYDMLRDAGLSSALAIREERGGEIYVQGLSEYIVKNVSDTLQLLQIAEENRKIRETNMNQFSSRSHSIFQLFLEQKRTAPDGGEITLKSKFNLVDLAGSEKWNTKLQMQDDHISEMTNINLSLHTLGKCISALVKRSRAIHDGTDGQGVHIPYRESKLTRLLQDSLGGNSKTLLIATVSPAASCSEESINTLKFADRAKQVMIQAKVNETRPVDHAMVQALLAEVKGLRSLLAEISTYLQSVVVSSTSRLKQSSSSPGGIYITNHAELAMEHDDEINEAPVESPSAQKAVLFQAIQSALGEGKYDQSIASSGLYPPKKLVENIAAYRPPAVAAAPVSLTHTDIQSGEQLRAAQSVIRTHENRLAQQQQREQSIWAHIDEFQGIMKKFFKYDIEEDDMKRDVNKVLASLRVLRSDSNSSKDDNRNSPKKDELFNRRAPLPSIDSGKESSRYSDSPNGIDLPPSGIAVHAARMSNSPEIHKSKAHQSKSDSRGGSIVDSSNSSRVKRESASDVVSAARKSVNAPPSQQQSSHDWTAAAGGGGGYSNRKRAPVNGSAELSVPPLNVSFRVKGVPSSIDQGDSEWKVLMAPLTEEETELMLQEQIKQTKKKKKQQEKIAEWLKSKEDRTLEQQQREAEEKAALEDAEKLKEEKRRDYARKQKQKLNNYHIRVKSDLDTIKQLNDMGLSPEDLVT